MPVGGYGAAMVPAGSGAMVPGATGPKGVVRSGVNVLLLSFVTCGLYQMFWLYQVFGEMSSFLQRDEPSFWKVYLFSSVTCGVYGLYWMLTRLGPLVQEVQQRAGVPNPENNGIMYLIPYYGVVKLQEDLNRAWQAGG
jgi:hypothetical protein